MRALTLALPLMLGLAAAPGAAIGQTGDYQLQQAFHGGKGGAAPIGGLVSAGNMLYGTTAYGGTGACQLDFSTGCGTVFSLDPSTGAVKTLYSFRGDRDGAYPLAAMIRVGSTLYGTTSAGGGAVACPRGCGTVFALDPATGAERTIYRFQYTDGANPTSSLIELGGMLYGTTTNGGTGSCGGGCGTIFALNAKTAAQQVLHSFQGGTDGTAPAAGLIAVKGILYGTTPYGGGAPPCGTIGCGTVFALNPASSAETVIHVFQNFENPRGTLINLGGTLYGTDTEGVFSLNPASGSARRAYVFKGSNDGDFALGSLVNVGGTLYGTTQFGGSAFGYGTVFAYTPATGAEQVVHAFLPGGDGAIPETGLTALGGKLYGTTVYGGNRNYPCFNTSCGTVFSLTP